MNIYVANLGYTVLDNDLTNLFNTYGTVTSAKIITDKFSGHSKGFGFVEMADDAAAHNAISQLNGIMMEGRPLKVSEAKPREERNNKSNLTKRW